jgi:hypothetical protein
LDGVTSPSINSGDPASSFAHEPTPNGGSINAGAYGNTVEASKSDRVDTTKKIFIIGDSTVRFDLDGDRDVNGSLHRTGWGSKLSAWMVHPENVFNRARRSAIAGGEEDYVHSYRRDAPIDAAVAANKGPYDWNSTKTLIEDANTSNGGFLLIQFGSNDKHHDVNETAFKAHVKFYIDQARLMSVTPILLTSINPKSTLTDTRAPFPDYLWEIGVAEDVPVLDLHTRSLAVYETYTLAQRYGLFGAWQLDGVTRDVTHLDRRGATIVAEWVKDLACAQSATQRLCEQFDREASLLYAYAGEDQDVSPDTVVDLNGSGLDTDGTIVSYLWEEGGTTLSSDRLLSYSSNVEGSHLLTLTVTDNAGNRATDTIEIGVHVPAPVTVVHEDAEDGETTGWNVYDGDPAGATINNVDDADRGSRVIELLTTHGTENGFSLTNLNITEGFIVSWSMRTSEDFRFFIKVKTSGHDPLYLEYLPVDTDEEHVVQDGKDYLRIGLGSYMRDDRWIHVVRDIQADLQSVFPDEDIQEIYGFYIRGNMRVDDIQTATTGEVTKRITREDGTVESGAGNNMSVSIYYQQAGIQKPTLYFVAGGGLDHRSYEHLLHHLVQQGYVVVAASYADGFNDTHISDNFFDAFVQGWNMCEDRGINDDNRTGLIGHSSGAGTLPSLAYKFFVEQGMGSQGRFVFGATPWVDFQWSNSMRLPVDTNWATQWYEDDHGTEPKIYLDMYKRMDVNHKTFITVKQHSDHYTIRDGVPLPLVEQGIYAPLDDLAKFTFGGVNQVQIFPEEDIDTDAVRILAAGTLPSEDNFDTMMQEFEDAGSDYPCDSAAGGTYASNPRTTECQGYRNKPDWYPPQSTFTEIATDTEAPYPTYLGSVLSSVHHNKISRVTDDAALRINHPYPKTPAWNIDSSLLLLTNALLDGRTYEVIRSNMSWDDNERKWSARNPHIYYSMQWARNHTTHACEKDNFRFVSRDVALTLTTGVRPSLEVLDDDFNCTLYDDVTIGAYEGNIDRHDKYVVFSAKKAGENNLTAILYDISTRTRVVTKTMPILWHQEDNASKKIYDWISVSPLGDTILLNFIEEPDRPDADYRGAIYQYDMNFDFVRKLADQGGHGDMGVRADGLEIYVQFEYGADRGIWGYPLDGSARIKLLDDKYSGGHISCRNTLRDGWCYVSTTQEGYREVFALKLDGSGTVERFAQTHTVGSNNSHGGVDPKGERMLFLGTWDAKSDNGRRETFVVEGL